ncbi:site-specific integrase [Polaribacter batillariae]|uniref:Site-specific integrase n=1 Tax=Polaribacter batillariae TaxID=2808900 RepID=A0ABX7SXQ1_9FLAO|nr:site-specific integrase [Polaribacter batillariae]QTD38981.1 site-specific integrase [Polaribacter batillariae]
MQHLFSFIFYIKRSKADKNGKANIYLRITVNGKRAELSISRKVDVKKWISSAGKMKGSSGEAQQLNKYIDSIANRIYKIHQKLVEENKLITAINIRNIYQGKNEIRKMTLEIFENHNIQMEKLIGKDYALGTSERYKTAKKHLKNYINQEYKIEDIPVKDINNKFITGFEYYLKTEKNCAHNTTIKYITNFKKIVRIAYANDWISKDPFYNWKARLKTVEREFLSKEEIEKLVSKELAIKRLNQVKDIFIFSCFTGLAYSDVKKLSHSDIVIGIDGNRWIKTYRTKTNSRSNIPLLSTAEAIIEKYSNHPGVVKSQFLLPVLSNQKMNAYLKEIADVCGINKNLTFHLARHTFATSVTLTNGVPIETVSKMLGHKSLKTTQHYAKILDKKVSEDMNLLKQRLSC